MPNAGNHAVTRPGQKLIERPIMGVLDQSINPARLPPGNISILQNYVYREGGGVAKRTGSGIDVGTGATGSGLPIRSGVRWYRGVPSVAKQMIVQSGDALYLRNDSTGAYTQIATLNPGSTPAFFASAFDPAQSGVAGTPASDVLIITYGSGAPLKWDGTHLTALSAAITNAFVGCEAWHNHVWFWGDPNNPDVVFGTDINNPESYAFSTNFGGYQIGPGDGDATVQRCFGDGAFLYVWKAAGIWAMQGYDYYQGNYQFSLTPVASGIGTTAPFSVGRMPGIGLIAFWTGATVKAIVSGTAQIVTLSVPVEYECGMIATGSQAVIRATAGSFVVATSNGLTVPYEDVYLLSYDDGTGFARRTLIYDGVKSAEGKPAWSVLLGWTVGAWIPWQGPNDPHRLYWGDGALDRVLWLGQNPSSDSSVPYTTTLQLNRDDCESADQDKWADYLYLRLEANAANFSGTLGSAAPSLQRAFNVATTAGAGFNWGQNWGAPNLWGPTSGTIYQSAVGKIDPWLRGKNFTLFITEQSVSSLYEILGYAVHLIEEAYARS